MSLVAALLDAYDIYPPREEEEADWHIVMSHHRRKIINNRLQEQAAAKETDAISIDGEMLYLCFAGAKLIGINLTLKQLANGAFLLVAKVSPETIALKDADTGLEFEVFPANSSGTRGFLGPSLSVVCKAGP